MRQLLAILLTAGLATGCAHHKITNREIAIGVIGAVVVGGLVYLAVEQCHKGAAFCDNSPPPGQ